MSLLVGLMSGTSLDGVDAALVDFSAERPRTIATCWQAYSNVIREQALQLQSSGPDEIRNAALLANELAGCYALAVAQVLAQARIAPEQVAAIGCHGQTIRHQPAAGYSVQINNPALLAELTGIDVVADFRSRDIAAGGQGAPLVPAFHASVFGDAGRHRVILNIGGIANLTDLMPGRTVRGFDCGPGNLLMDAWTERHTGARFDTGGQWAAQGQVLPGLLDRLLGDAFLAANPPKSCGRDEFNLPWLERHLSGSERPVDVQATLLELTASAAILAIRAWCGEADELFVCGGGAHNCTLMDRLQHHAPACRVASTDLLGMPADWVEAVAFAWLAWRAMNREPGNLADVTGARGARVLGAIWPR